MKKNLIPICILTGSLLLATDAWAYIDPGAGSMLLQGLLAAIAAGFVAAKLYWHKVKTFLFSRGQRSKASADEIPDTDDTR